MTASAGAASQGAAGSQSARDVILGFLDDSGLDYEVDGGTIAVVLPGVQKLRTTVSLALGTSHVTVNAFVVRHPDENETEFHAWLLRRNSRMYCVGYAIDHLGDVYLTGHIPNAALSSDELDRVFGSIVANADEPFNTLLELGFASSIRKEWIWRLSRGEPTGNLEAFRHLAPEAASGN